MCKQLLKQVTPLTIVPQTYSIMWKISALYLLSSKQWWA